MRKRAENGNVGAGKNGIDHAVVRIDDGKLSKAENDRIFVDRMAGSDWRWIICGICLTDKLKAKSVSRQGKLSRRKKGKKDADDYIF